MNKLDIRNIIEDILRLDPTLVSKKTEVEKLVSAMLSQKPDVTVDEAFLSRLRSRLVEQMSESEQKTFSFGQLFVSHKLVFVGALGCLTVGIVSASLLYAPAQNTRIAMTNGFGSLVVTASDMTTDTAALSQNTAPSTALIDRNALGGESAKMMVFPPNDSFEYGQMTFVFPDGEQIQTPESTLPVYGYQASSGLKKSVDASVKDVWKELFGTTPSGVRGQNLSGLVTIKGETYSFGIDTNTSVLSLLRHDSDQLSGYYRCRKSSDPCLPYEPLVKSDMPAEAEVLSLAQDTLDALGIDTSGYGEPIVLPPPVYTLYTEAGMPIDTIPDTVDVLYPLFVEGTAVVDSSGVATVGMRLSVSIRDMAVASVNDIPAGPLVSSRYEMITDTDRIMALARSGGQYGMWGQVTKEPLSLGDPRLIYTSIWKQDADTYAQHMLFVPAYAFDITYPVEIVDRQYLQKSLIIPLEKELFEQAERDALNRQNQGKYPVPMPLIRTLEAGSEGGNILVDPAQ